MSTKTQTTTTHYHIQKKRRAEFIEEWRKYRQNVIREEDVTLQPTPRGLRTGVYMGWDGERPTRCLDALVHEIDPGASTTIHRANHRRRTGTSPPCGYDLTRRCSAVSPASSYAARISTLAWSGRIACGGRLCG